MRLEGEVMRKFGKHRVYERMGIEGGMTNKFSKRAGAEQTRERNF